MKKEHVLLTKFAVLLTFVFMGQAFTFTLLLPYMTSVGYDEATQGLILAFGAILTIVGQFLVGYICDKLKTDKKVFLVASIALAVVNWFLYSSTSHPLLLIFLWVGLLFSLFRITQGVLDSWVIESDKYCLDNYGLIRAFGAIGWAIGAPLTSFCFERWGYSSLGTAFFGFTILTLILSFFVKDAVKVEAETKLKFSDIKELILNQNFIMLTLILLFLSIAMAADGYTSIYKMMDLGKTLGQSEAVTNSQINLKYSFQALCELPLFFLGGVVLKKFGGIKVLFFASAMTMLRFVLYALAIEPMQIVWISSLQAVTFPLFMVCSKILIDEVSPVYLRAGGQQISAGVYGGVSSLVAPIFAGIMVKTFSYNISLLIIGGTCIVPISMLVYYSRKRKSQDNQ